MYTFSKAKELFDKKEYKQALLYYKELAKIYGDGVVSYNISQCEKYIKESSNKVSEDLSFSFSNPPKEKFIKSNDNFLNGIFDNVYIVNLDFQIEKRLKVCNHVNSFNISYELFKAKNGYANPIKEQFEEYLKKPLGSLIRYPDWNEREIKRGKHYIESAGAMGYIHTYISILKEAKKKGYKRILILEDDILLSKNFKGDFLKFIQSIGNDWKVLQLGASQYNWDSVNHEDSLNKGYYFPRQLDTCGSFAIGLDMSIADELIKELEYFEAPFDHLPLGSIYEKYLGKCFVCYPNIIIPDVGVSYIRGERNQYEHAKKMRWQMDRFEYPLEKLKIGLFVTSKEQIKYFSSFSNKIRSVFDLRLFYLSQDGIRPIHNIEFFLEQNELLIEPKLEQNFNLDVHVLGKMIGRIPLTERDILFFIQKQLKITEVDTKLIQPLAFSSNFVKGMISVIIPTFKRKSPVINAIQSVVNQDYKEKEIIIVDDNVEKEYSEYLEKEISNLKSKYPTVNIHYIKHSKNRNGSAARNTGIFFSKGEYISFLDDDDVYLEGRLTKSVKVLESSNQKSLGGVYCGFLGWNSPKNDLNRYSVGDLTKDLLTLNYKVHYMHTNTATYLREKIMDLMGFDESYRRHQDFEFNLRFFEKYQVDVVKEALVKLKPEPVQNSNILKNLEFIDLKIKFLNQFDYIISKYGNNEASQIYEIHWADVMRYCNLEEISMIGFNSNYRNPWLFFMKKIFRN